MMQRNPRALLRGRRRRGVLRPTGAAVPRARTSTPCALQPTGRPLFRAHRRTLSTYSLGNYDARPVDIKELPGSYSYVLDVTGLRAGDLTVQLVSDRWIEVIGERREEVEAGACIYRRKDRPMGMLQHSFCLPQDAYPGRMSAVCRDGVLTVTIEKLPPTPAPVVVRRTIQVRS